MRILLIGATGQLGRSFVEQGGLLALGELTCASRDGRCFDGRSIAAADLSEPESLIDLLDQIRPQIILNAAAYTAVDRAESEEDLATCVNGRSVGVLGAWAKQHDALVVHYSTDYVFDGHASHPYGTDAPTAPLGAYGRSKLAGEIALRASGAHHLIFRTAWVYAPHGQNFFRTMLRVGAERETLRVVSDQRGAPTPAHVIVAGTLAALQQWMAASAALRTRLEGTHHLVAGGETTWHGFASAIFDLAVSHGTLIRRPEIQAISTADFPTPARRPAYSVLDNSGFQSRFAFTLPSWRDGLDTVMRNLAFKDS